MESGEKEFDFESRKGREYAQQEEKRNPFRLFEKSSVGLFSNRVKTQVRLMVIE